MANATPPTPATAMSDAPGHAGVNPIIEEAPPSSPFPVVAIGSSAGGVQALIDLVGHVPADTGMAFVFVPHLSGDHPSHLAEILGRASPMPVRQATQGMPLAANQLFVIPPGMTMVLSRGQLQLAPRDEPRGKPRSIDLFMRSVAQECGHKAIGIVLSGLGHDGTLGLAEIKGAGGMTFAQDDSAEQSGMPESAAGSGCVDFVMGPAQIAGELARIARHPYLAARTVDANAPAVARVIDHLRTATGVDFAQYKRNTLNRRITRRMVMHKLPDAAAYLDFLESHPEETAALHADLLIGVTSFFRNPDSYDALKARVFPRLVEGRGPLDIVRLWTLGCSTGEEAYSLAMAYTEFCDASGCRVPVQVFATDLNGAGIEKARSGMYAKAIAQDVSPERLARFFVEVDGSYRVGRGIRDLCVFERHNVMTDPPFSNIDLVSCRNLLIYMEPALQQRVIPVLHYALRQHGFLWLGGSETIGSYRDLFEPLDVRHKIYAKKAGARRAVELPTRPSGPRWSAAPGPAPAPKPAFDPQREADRLVIARYAPPGVVIDPDFAILQFRGDTSAFLAPSPGKPSLSLLKMLREGLMVPVRDAVHRAHRENVPIREEGLRVKSHGAWREVDVVVVPIRGHGSAGALLVLFEESATSLGARVRQLEAEASASGVAVAAADASAAEKEIARLALELNATRDYLQAVIEQQEAANEELQSANEESQSANEELQSINEELETSKEEIQSANEELATVNAELQVRNAELSRSNDDFTNLLESVHVAILMLGPDLRLRRFTPAAETLLGLRAPDIGRRVGDIAFAVALEGIERLARDVMESTVPREMEVRNRGGRWHPLRLQPYRTVESRVEGVVMLLVDIDTVKSAEEALREGDRAKNEFLATLAHELRNPLAGITNAVPLLELGDKAAADQARRIIKRQADHMARMVEELLDVSRITHGKIQLRSESVDLREMVERSIASTAHDRKAKDQEIAVSLPGHPVRVRGDPMRLDQIFSNLLNNASKFTPSGGRLEVSVGMDGTDGEGGWATAHFRDNGVGIDPALLPRIFELYVQGDRKSAGGISGMGLGLTLARRLVELHGGTIEARSAGGSQGTEIVVRLPCEPGAP